MARPTATGLRKRETYEQLIDYLQNDQELIKYPNRYFRQLRDSPWLSHLDDEYPDKLDEQQLNEARIIQKETIIREVTAATGMSAPEIRSETHHHKNTTNNTTNNYNYNTYTSEAGPQGPRGPPGPPGSAHPLKEATGTGTDYMPPPPPGF